MWCYLISEDLSSKLTAVSSFFFTAVEQYGEGGQKLDQKYRNTIKGHSNNTGHFLAILDSPMCQLVTLTRSPSLVRRDISYLPKYKLFLGYK